jgi:cytochrome c biogenesis protein CcmG/thiol:disulfide interchange protein DsbE
MSEEPAGSAASPGDSPARAGKAWVFVPLAIFLAFALMFQFALKSGDPSKLPSALIGKPVPPVDFTSLDGLTGPAGPVPGFAAPALARGEVTIVNFWASWCAPCVEEHPLLVELAKMPGVRLYGVNYKDEAESARRFLGRYGNPFSAMGVDPKGRGAIEWGVYGMPETFVVDGKGRITYKHVGPLSPRSIEEKILPAVRDAAGTAPGS